MQPRLWQIGDVSEDIGEPDEWIDTIQSAVLMTVYVMAAHLPPRSIPTNN